MAAAVLSTSTPAAYCVRLENYSRAALLKMGLDGSGLEPTSAEETLGITAGSIAAQALQLAVDGFVTFEFDMAADTNTAGVFNLTDLGVDFPADTSRRLGFECLVSADVDKAFLFQESLVAGAATPIVYNPAITVDPAGTATSIRGIGAGDLISTSVVVPTAVFSQSSNEIILTLTGVTNIDTRWKCKVKVYPKVSHSLIATT